MRRYGPRGFVEKNLYEVATFRPTAGIRNCIGKHSEDRRAPNIVDDLSRNQAGKPKKICWKNNHAVNRQQSYSDPPPFGVPRQKLVPQCGDKFAQSLVRKGLRGCLIVHERASRSKVLGAMIKYNLNVIN